MPLVVAQPSSNVVVTPASTPSLPKTRKRTHETESLDEHTKDLARKRQRRCRLKKKNQKEAEEKERKEEEKERKERDLRCRRAQVLRKQRERQRKLMLGSRSITVSKSYKARADVALQICARFKGYLGALKSAGTAQRVTNTDHYKQSDISRQQ